MTCNTRHSTSCINLVNLLTRSLAAIGMVVLLSGFTVIEVEFNSMDVPPSKFKIRLAKQKGLPAPEGVPGLPVKATLTNPRAKAPFLPSSCFLLSMDGRILPDTGENASTPGVVTLEVGAENEVPSKVEEPLNQVLDAIGALKYLQEVPYVDSDRVAVMGWALGAETALGAIDASSWAGGQA